MLMRFERFGQNIRFCLELWYILWLFSFTVSCAKAAAKLLKIKYTSVTHNGETSKYRVSVSGSFVERPQLILKHDNWLVCVLHLSNRVSFPCS